MNQPTMLLGKVLLIATLLATPVMAAGNKPSVSPSKAQQGNSTVCAKVSSGVDALTTRYAQNRETHTNRYTRMHQTLTQLMAKLSEKGYDTAALGQDLDTLQGYIGEFDGYHEQFMNMLQQTKALACDEENDGQYRNKMEEARSMLRQMRETAQNTFQLVKEEIKQDLLDLKEQTP